MLLKDNLKKLRKDHGLTQAKLATRIDVTKEAILKWESGAADPRLINLMCLADLYKISLDELCCRERR